MNEKVINIHDKNVVITKLPLKKYAELLSAFEELPKHLDLIQGKSQDELIVNFPKLLGTCYPDVVRVVVIATAMTPEEVDQMGLDDFVAVMQAVLEVNNYSDIYARIKKLTARPVTNQVTPVIEPGSTGQ